MKVLVLEDDDLFGELLETVIAGSGYGVKVSVCDRLSDAVRLADTEPFDLVVTDWNLPDGSGLELIRRIRRFSKETPVVIVSARSDRDSVLKAAHYGINGYITKPVDVTLLHSRLAEFLPGKQQDVIPVSEYLEQALGHIVQLPSGVDPSGLLELARRERELSPAQLAERWRDEPALAARLLDVANSTSFRRTGQPVENLRDAISSMGITMALNQALALALDVSGGLRWQPLKTMAQEINEQIMGVSRAANALAIRLGLPPSVFQQAGLLSRLGELALIKVLDDFVALGGKLEPEDLAPLLKDWAPRFGNRLKVQWHLPLGLRELVGAVHFLPPDSTRDRQLVMRAAALEASELEGKEEHQRLLRRLGLDNSP
ncbi:response regulator [Marinobacter sp. VGCF2001]|uniref:response regulator n=1 Tax=Marinobacter sp. VGCF2001 TaxID=3417189 RepID=UPI003CF30DE6